MKDAISTLTRFMNTVDGFLLAFCTFDKESAKPKIIQWLNLGLDWEEILHRAGHHRLLPMLYYHLSDQAYKDLVPSHVVDGLRNDYITSTANTMHKLTVLGKMLAAFEAAGIHPIILKGPVLAQTLYPEKALRQFEDIDILIREEDWPGVRVALMQLGFSPNGKDRPSLPLRLTKEIVLDHWISFQRNDGVNVDCKFDLLELGLRTRSLDNVWERAETFKMGNQAVKKLSVEDELLMLGVHLNRHGFSRLSWFLDISELLKEYRDRIDWDYLCGMAKKENIKTIIFHVFSNTGSLLGSPVPKKAMERLRPFWFRSKIWEMSWPEQSIATFSGRRDEIITFYDKSLRSKWLIPNILLTGRAGGKIKYILRRVFPPKDYLMEKYPLDGKTDGGNYLRYLLERYRTSI